MCTRFQYVKYDTSSPFILSLVTKRNQIKHLSQARPDSVTIHVFKLAGREICSDVRDHTIGYKKFVTAQNYFSHHIAFPRPCWCCVYAWRVASPCA